MAPLARAQIAAGTHHTVVASARGVYAFGSNSHGQLGLGSTADTPVPVRVKTPLQPIYDPIVRVAAGARHSLFISERSVVWAAGSCARGQYCVEATSSFPRSSGSGTPQPPQHLSPVLTYLPFLRPPGPLVGERYDIAKHLAPPNAPILHEAVAGGDASVFLIRAPDEPVRGPGR